jgi:V/A-type H+-transporting ATPase subunit I
VIVNVDKCLVIGVKKDLDLFFEKAQQEGLFEFISQAKKQQQYPKFVQDIITAIKILNKEGDKSLEAYGKEYSLQELVNRIIYLKNTLEKYKEEQRVLAQEILAISHFGDFSFETIEDFQRDSHRVFQFFFRGKNKRDLPLPSEELIYISSDLHSDYYIGIHEEAKFFPDFVEMRFDKEASLLKAKLEQIEYDLKVYAQELKQLIGYKDFLNESLLNEVNKYSLQSSKKHTVDHFDGEVFSVEAWIPEEDFSKALKLVEDLDVHIEKISIETADRIPTCMKNKGYKRVGEDLVQIYDIPSHTDKDPSLFVLVAFSIFFAMIVADAGYGFVYLLLSLLAWFKIKKKSEAITRINKLFFLISSCCIVWGIMIGSYFGIALSPENPLQRVSVLQELILQKASYHMKMQDEVFRDLSVKIGKNAVINSPLDFVVSIKKGSGSFVSYPIIEEFNNSILMEIAILTGVIHIIISLLRYGRRNFSSFGWVLFIIGGYLFFPSMMSDATSLFHFLGIIPKKGGAEVGKQLVFLGVGLAWVLALIQHKKKGLEEPLKSIQIFADILSYLRLYALSLAGIIMAGTFNQMGQEVGYVFGFFIILAGHVLNMIIGIMGGFIHGLRLNFLEWYHYCFEGSGKLFNPLRILK